MSPSARVERSFFELALFTVFGGCIATPLRGQFKETAEMHCQLRPATNNGAEVFFLVKIGSDTSIH